MSTRKYALVTGGTRGIGFAVVEALLDDTTLGEEWAVMFCGRDAGSIERAIARLPSSHQDRIEGRACDVSRQSEVDALVAAAEERFGRIDCLVNNAGVGHFAPVDEISGDDWRRVIETNLNGAFYATRAVAPGMKARRSGWIFNIASLAGRNPLAGGAVYNASKFGLVGFSDATMLDLREYDIRVCAILPGSVATDFSAPRPEPDDWKLTADDVARAVVDTLRYPIRALPSRIELRPTRTRPKV